MLKVILLTILIAGCSGNPFSSGSGSSTSQSNTAEVIKVQEQNTIANTGIPWYWALLAGILIPFPTPRGLIRHITGR